MLIYRYEMPDGGGPFFTLDGVQRRTGVKLPPSEYIFGCKNIDDLNKYFNNVENISEECKIVVRDIPANEIYYLGNQIMFKKSLL